MDFRQFSSPPSLSTLDLLYNFLGCFPMLEFCLSTGLWSVTIRRNVGPLFSVTLKVMIQVDLMASHNTSVRWPSTCVSGSTTYKAFTYSVETLIGRTWLPLLQTNFQTSCSDQQLRFHGSRCQSNIKPFKRTVPIVLSNLDSNFVLSQYCMTWFRNLYTYLGCPIYTIDYSYVVDRLNAMSQTV